MTRTISVLQLGLGQVGSEAVRLVTSQAHRWLADYDLDVRYEALGDSSALVAGLAAVAPDQPFALLDARAAGQRLASQPDAVPWPDWARMLDDALARAESPEHLVVMDCASGPATAPLLLAARAAGAHVVLANKDPLAGPLAWFQALTRGNGHGSLRNSATVGAGLPVLATLRGLLASGDRLLGLGALASGSLGYLCTMLSEGVTFDEAVRRATALGYTEPDPRQDLSGFDVARKLLILARTAGAAVEMADVRVESLVPPGAADLPAAEFSAALSNYSDWLADRVAQARASGQVLRYVARMEEDGSLSASLQALPPDDPLARTHGPESMFILQTARYHERPLVISGPGAGASVTAGAVVADLLRAVGVL